MQQNKPNACVATIRQLRAQQERPNVVVRSTIKPADLLRQLGLNAYVPLRPAS